jgi:hypothetical protein
LMCEHTWMGVSQDGDTLLAAMKFLHRQLVENAVEFPVMWVTDGQSARFNIEVLRFCVSVGIYPFLYPPHTTTIHAPLDRIFKDWHAFYEAHLERWSRTNPGAAVTKKVFILIFAGAWEEWISTSNLAHAFTQVCPAAKRYGKVSRYRVQRTRSM